jgi:phosphate transport system permease protein
MGQDHPQGDDLIKPPGIFGWRVDRQKLIKTFFGASAAVTIAVLLLIVWSLIREGAGFLPTYRWELAVYRQAGLEYVDYIQKPLSGHEAILSKLNRSYNAELNTISGPSRDRRNAAYLAKSQIESTTRLQRETLLAALQNSSAPPNQEIITGLREAVSIATQAAAHAQPLPDVFTADEKQLLRDQLSSLQPDNKEPPPFIAALVAEAAIKDREARDQFRTFFNSIEKFDETVAPLRSLIRDLRDTVVSTKAAATQHHMSEAARASLFQAAANAKTPEERLKFETEAAATDTTPVDFASLIQPVLARQAEIESIIHPLIDQIQQAAAAVPTDATTKEARELLRSAQEDLPEFIENLEASIQNTRGWKWDQPVPLTQALTAFLFGGDWITNSSWQDFYGVIPLLTGSLLISLTALAIALPISVAAAIYVSQFASTREQEIVKPVIEFIQAIPSVVLGFIGISVVGDLIKSTSEIEWLQWIPGFPVQERLHMFNAGCLLALMAIPTMFSLAEDAINNVPRAFSEASEALGSTKLQSVFRVILPASLPGIFAAMLLGLGRIIGETMVVLLVAGNRIAIPNFSDGLGTIFQPAHTLTGIIAQELGEVSRGSSHWQALFMVGLLLFFFSLFINWASRIVLRKFRLPKI